MAYKLTVLDSALEELDEAVKWYAEISQLLSIDLVSKYKVALHRIVENPFHFQLLNGNFRKINIERFPYKIVFIVFEEEIIVASFAHFKKKPDYWISR